MKLNGLIQLMFRALWVSVSSKVNASVFVGRRANSSQSSPKLDLKSWCRFDLPQQANPIMAAISVQNFASIMDAGLTGHLKCNLVSLFAWIVHGFEKEN